MAERNEGEEGSGKNGDVGNSMPVTLAENLGSMSVAGHLSEGAGRAVVVGVSGRVNTESNACVCSSFDEMVSETLSKWPGEGESSPAPRKGRLTDEGGEGLDLEAVHGDNVRLERRRRASYSQSTRRSCLFRLTDLAAPLAPIAMAPRSSLAKIQPRGQHGASSQKDLSLRRVVRDEDSDAKGSTAEERTRSASPSYKAGPNSTKLT